MSKLLYWLRSFRVFIAHWPGRPEDCSTWNNEDRIALDAFLKSGTGQRLMQSFEQIESLQNRAAVLRAPHNEYSAGWAAGWHGAFAWFKTLSVIATPQNTANYEDSNDKGAQELLDTLSP